MSHSYGSIGKSPAIGSTGVAGTNGGVVVRTASNNKRALNPGGTGGTGVTKTMATRSSTKGRAVVGQKGRTVAGTNKVIGQG